MTEDPFDHWKHNETWREMMLRKDDPSKASSSAAVILACLIVLPFVAWMIVEVLDKHFA